MSVVRRGRRRFLRTVAVVACPSLCSGVDDESVPSVSRRVSARDRGLAYLERSQTAEGAIAARPQPKYPVAFAALASIALAAAGRTLRRRRESTLSRIVDFLVAQQQTTGLIAAASKSDRPMFGHGYSVAALAALLGTEPDATKRQRLLDAVVRGVRFLAQTQSRRGGWTYLPDGGDEASVTTTQLQALDVARRVEVPVAASMVERAIAYLAACQNDDGGIRYGLGAGSESRASLTAAALCASSSFASAEETVLPGLRRYFEAFGGEAFDTTGDARPVSASGGFDKTAFDYYAAFYLTQAAARFDSPPLRTVAKRLQTQLVAIQNPDGAFPDGMWGRGLDPVYAAAMATATLSWPDRLLPAFG